MRSEYNGHKDWYRENMLLDVVNALKNRDFVASFFATADETKKALLEMIPADVTIGIGGSVTIRELAIIPELEKKSNTIVHHWKEGLAKERDRETRQKEGAAEYYLTSANAITKDGDIINIDGIGNRVSHMIYGPNNVIIIAGYNKIVTDIDEGIIRSKEIAAVMNA